MVVVVMINYRTICRFSSRLETGNVDILIINQQLLKMSRDHAKDETKCVRT